MKIHIKYDSKWSFSSTRNGENYLQSMKMLKEGEDRTKEGFIESKNSFLENVSLIKKRLPNYDYQSISKDTVLGLLCRLIGDVRRLSEISIHPEVHPILKISDYISFEDDEQSKQFQSEVMLLHTIEKDVPGNGSGVITRAHCFSNYNDLSASLFSVFNARSLHEIKVLYGKMQNLDPSILQDKYIGPIYPRRLIEEMAYFEEISKEELSKIFFSTFIPNSKVINIGGILLSEKIKYLKTLNYFVDELAPPHNVNSVGCIAGITLGTGSLTPKDYYVNFVSKKKQSSTMPYQVKTYGGFYKKEDLKDFNQGASLGVIKECGKLSININRPIDECHELYERIESASVQNFQLGKKGLAYISKIEF